MANTPQMSDTELEEARKKYNAERDKRQRSTHNEQYISVEGEFSELDQDPYVETVIHREAMTRDIEVAVVGAGVSGVTAAVELTKAGVEDVWLIDKASDVGGTWYWNRYPGVRCDVESYIYLPYLEETGYVPTEKYTRGNEIFEHFKRIANHWNLYERAIFQTRITSVIWDEDDARWDIRTDRGDVLRARYVVFGTGPLSRPKLPGVDGIKDFTGKVFLSARWDYDYTGGDQNGGLTNLRGKRVAIIGTGASAVQAVPEVAEYADQLYVFQRTPSAVDLRNNQPTDTEWFKSQPAGWLQQRAANFDAILAGLPHEGDLVGDQWGQVWGGVAEIIEEAGADVELMGRLLAERDLSEMNRIRTRVDEIVKDQATADALKPYYDRFCKRPTFNDEYLDAFNKPNVTLVNTEGQGVQKITPDGVSFGGNEYKVDCIIFATGFELAPGPARAGGFDIIGVDGRSWGKEREERVATLHGLMSNGYPNMFIVGGQHQAAVTINLTFVFKEQSRHVAEVISRLRRDGVVTVDVLPDAERQWGEVIAEKSVYSEASTALCTPGNWNNEGDLAGDTVWKTRFGGGPFEYLELLEEWQTSGLERDLNITRRS